MSAPHTTILLTTTSGINAYNLSWTAYVGFTPSKYRIFRGPALNTMVQIDSVANTVLTYVDSFPPINSFYAIEAVNPAGACVPTLKIKGHNALATLSGSFSNGFNTAILGMPDFNSQLIEATLFPNPSNVAFNLSYTLPESGKVHVSVLSELGQVVYDKTELKASGKINEQINAENWADGIYTVLVKNNSGFAVKKLAVIHNK